jgi:hypothetical protein
MGCSSSYQFQSTNGNCPSVQFLWDSGQNIPYQMIGRTLKRINVKRNAPDNFFNYFLYDFIWRIFLNMIVYLGARLKRMNQVESARCSCQEADQTPEHVLLDCPLWRTQGDIAWPEGATLAKQPWGSADELIARGPSSSSRTSASMSDM